MIMIKLCTNPKCSNPLYCFPWREGSYADSALNELSDAQFFLLAHLVLNEQKATEKLKKLMGIPFQKMNKEEITETKAELEKFNQEVLELLGKMSLN